MDITGERAAIKAYSILTIIIVISFFVSLSIGRYPIPIRTTFRIIISKLIPIEHTWNKVEESVIINLRLPRVIMALSGGAGLAVCGAIFQGIFRNPLVSPGVIGVTAGAGFGAAFGILLFGWGLLTQGFAFIFGAAALFMTYTITKRTRGNSLLIFVLAGVIVNLFFQALISLIKFTADAEEKLPSIVYWLMGSLSTTSYENLYICIPLIFFGTVMLVLLRWRINVLSLGEETVKALGINPQRLILIILLLSTVVVSAVVSVAGIVGWIGLIIPHIARMIVGPDHEVLLPTSALIGGIFFLVIDDIARTLTPLDIPLGIITALVGTPVFIYLLIKSQGEWSL